ncbi:MAG: class I mannose-6-phosphate isomerase [Clostridia bacterium]|nr:class I mannose-6-phosphate isomerase [Clostridia bacterium]
MSKNIIFLNPIFKETIWGGNKLKLFGYSIPSDTIGECWGISAHKNGDCTICGGEYKGMTLSQLWNSHRDLFGNCEGDCFPLLVKIIDAKKDLSIQVHPDDRYAMKHENGSLGKTECWYVLDCEKNSTIIIGHNAKNSIEVENMITGRHWKEFIREIPVHKGDFFQIEPGCVHAIKGGTLILETQQNSDITYRVYDYDRLSNGQPRNLHIEQSIDVIQAPFKESSYERTISFGLNYTCEKLIECPLYCVESLKINGSAQIPQTHPFMNMSVISGEGTIDNIAIKKGTHFILPYNYGNIEFKGDMQIITSYIQ